MVKSIKWWFLDNWQSVLLYFALLAITSLGLLFQLGGLTENLSSPEVVYIESTASIGQILSEPTFLPHKLLTFLASSISHSTAVLRLPSVVIAEISILVAVFYLRRIYSRRTVILAVLLIVSSSWLLSIGRLALPQIALVLWAPLFCLWEYLKRTKKSNLAIILLATASASAIYVPGFLWLILGLFILERKAVKQLIGQASPWANMVGAGLLIALLLPLLRASILAPQQLLVVSGLPTTLTALGMFPQNFIRSLGELFVLSHKGAVFTVGRLPVLDIFSIVLLLCGIYAQRYSSRQWRLILGAGALVCLTFVSLSNLITSAVLIPLVYALTAAGIGFLLTQWFTVFPYNPIAKSVGTTLLTLGVLTIAFYHINRYFIAWSQAPDTRKQFSHSLVK